jgi:hypothetical protein
METRRALFQDIAALAAFAALTPRECEAQGEDESRSKFWDAYFDEATREGTTTSRAAAPGVLDSAKQVQLIHATPDGLRYPSTIPDAELRGDSNDVVVTLNPGHFRPAPDDHRAISKSRGCQVRLDWFQKQPIMNLLAPMAWAGLAAWSEEKTTYDPKTKKTTAGPNPPALKDLDFRDPNDPNAPVRNEVILMGGSGRLAVNVTAVRVNQRLRTVLDRTVRYSSIVAPFFGFAPLAIPALRAFTDLLGAIFSHDAVIMNSLPVQVLATQGARRNPHDVNSIKIVSGDFIAVPAVQTTALKGDLEKLRVENGWLVHQDASKNLPPEERAKDPKVPEVTYMSMNLSVEALADVVNRKGKGG